MARLLLALCLALAMAGGALTGAAESPAQPDDSAADTAPEPDAAATPEGLPDSAADDEEASEPLPLAEEPPDWEPPPPVFFSEVMLRPQAVGHLHGEWLELHNASHEPVNLRNWTLVAHARDQHRIVQDVWLEPGGYVVLARHGDPAASAPRMSTPTWNWPT